MESHEFLIVDHTNKGKDEEPALHLVSLKELWDELDKAREDGNVLIAVYEIGDCVLDWS